MAARRRRPPVSRFLVVLRLITLVTLPPVGIALVELGRTIPPWSAALIAIALLGGLLWGIGPRVQAGFQDRPRPRWIGALAMPLFDVVWTASIFSPIACGLFALFAFPVAALRGTEAPGIAAVTQMGCLVSLVLALYGVFVRRRWIRMRRVEVPIADLPEKLDGYRIAHLSDLHIGSTASASEAKRWIARANDLGADLVAVTGDLVSTGSHFHGDVIDVLSMLRGRDGVYACLGNHDYYEEERLCAGLAERGVRVLRNEGLSIAPDGRDGAKLWVAGVEDAWRGEVDLGAALDGRVDDQVAVLLAHNPVLFPHAAQHGVHLTLSGHTHAGQVGVPFLEGGLARLTTRYAGGLFREGRSSLFVHAGLGTTGPAIRLGVAPEIVEIVLRRA
jgi:predicted MPP superfamily phosphohydrolase